MSIEIKMLLIVILFLLLKWSIVKLIKTIFNLIVLIKANKHPEDYPRTSGGIVFNKKTGKLEGSGSKPILPF